MAKKSSKIPKSLTTVTTFSKIIALILFALLPIAGFFIGRIYQEKLDNLKVSSSFSVPYPVK